MVSLLPALAMDSLRQALAKASVQSMERALKLQSPPFTGLPGGLAAEDAADGGILSLNLTYIGPARMGSPRAAAPPVIPHYVGHTAAGVAAGTSLRPPSTTQTRT